MQPIRYFSFLSLDISRLLILLSALASCTSTTGIDQNSVELHEDSALFSELMPYSELEKVNTKLPYIYQYSNEGKSIMVYGSYHTSNPNDTLVGDIRAKISDFNPDLVLYEGDGIGIENTWEQSMKYYFEMGLVRFISRERGTTDMNLEPPATEKYKHLLRKHTKEEVLLATIGSQIILLLVSDTTVDFKQFYGQFIQTIEEEGYPVEEHEKKVDYFYNAYERYYGIPFHFNTFDYETIEIKFNKTTLNQINQESAHFRDIHMLKLIKEQLKKHKRIYVQIGGRHAIVWEPAIKKMLEK